VLGVVMHASNLSYWEGRFSRFAILRPAWVKLRRLYLKNKMQNKYKRAGDIAQVVKYLYSMDEVLSSLCSTIFFRRIEKKKKYRTRPCLPHE
jgi:hypothetical protein